MENCNKYFNICIGLARKAFAAGEIPVGCVIVDSATGSIVARAHNMSETARNPLKHAEMLAIERATRKIGKNLSGCEAYVSLAPCVMCAAAFTYARVPNVYYCAVDLKTGLADSQKCKRIAEIDKNLYPTVFEFLQSDSQIEAENLLRNFFAQLRAGRK